MAPPEPFHPLELLGALLDRGVDFVVVGGLSLAAHGVVRATRDLDIVPDPSPGNLERLARALGALKAKVALAEDFEPREHGIEPDAHGLGRGGNWRLDTAYGALDIMQDLPGFESYDRLRARAAPHEVPGLHGPTWFAGLDDLIAMKRAAGRDQDLIDISDLERARGLDEGG